jgi:hypothetical protein
VSDVERSDGSNQAAPWRPPLSLILVSVLAAVAAIVHMAFPSLTIDGVTLGLLAVAALPWLAPVVKSLKFGSLEVDLRDLQQNLYEVRDRVEESAQKVVDRGRATPVYYSARTGRILVARKLTGDLGRVLWSSGDYLCSSVVQLPSELVEPATAGGQIRAGGLPLLQLPRRSPGRREDLRGLPAGGGRRRPPAVPPDARAPGRSGQQQHAHPEALGGAGGGG